LAGLFRVVKPALLADLRRILVNASAKRVAGFSDEAIEEMTAEANTVVEED